MSNDTTLDATLEVLREAGISPTVKQNRHLKIEFEHGGKPRTIIVSATPSDRRAALEARTVARRVFARAGRS